MLLVLPLLRAITKFGQQTLHIPNLIASNCLLGLHVRFQDSFEKDCSYLQSDWAFKAGLLKKLSLVVFVLIHLVQPIKLDNINIIDDNE